MIAYVTQSLFGRAMGRAARRPAHRVGRAGLSGTVAGGAVPGSVTRCELGLTPFRAKEPITRERAAELHTVLVRRAEKEWGALDDVDDPDDDAGDGLAVLDRLNELDGAEVEALPIAEGGEA